ncbi:hypothetical protein [Mycoplasma mycoides]|uniref:hypothetical protein n=1 Tax=Mycoplasma mycoides TaxID=2102 RepID=UPI00223FEC0D|nr:hypothetical protein [Mycoplasma mycoides]QVJ96018.1 hypothetical protein I7632_03215 [Mycoplasma mycoides subsp. capri]QVJ96912.1 hypothetical protein I7633_03170 [Mycoplasma mycoides subsp. capri]QVK00775.1 hypothetical protein I7635_03165 [Mycoplasma mycoides subsp. capri]
MKLKKTVWIPLVCAPILLTAAIVPPVVIYKNKQKVTKPTDNKKPTSDKQPKPTPQSVEIPQPTTPTKPTFIVNPNIETLKIQLQNISQILTSKLSNKKYKTLQDLNSEIRQTIRDNNNSFNRISSKLTDTKSVPEHIWNTTINVNLKIDDSNKNSVLSSTSINNVSIGVYDIDEIISRKKMWVEIEELENFKNNTYPDKVKEDFFYLLKKNNYDNLDESIFNKDSYTYDFSETEVKNVYKNETTTGEGLNKKTTIKYKFTDMEPTESWYKTKMKIKKNHTKNDFVDWNNKDELELTLYAFIPTLFKIDLYYSYGDYENDGQFILIDKDGDEKRVNKKVLLVDDGSYDEYDFEKWKKQGWKVEEIIAWNGIFKAERLPYTIKRFPKLKPSYWSHFS